MTRRRVPIGHLAARVVAPAARALGGEQLQQQLQRLLVQEPLGQSAVSTEVT